jgi:hypothetical protein
VIDDRVAEERVLDSDDVATILEEIEVSEAMVELAKLRVVAGL